MTPKVVTVSPETPVHAAFQVMQRQHIRRLPVLQGPALAGIVTWTDLAAAGSAPGQRSAATHAIPAAPDIQVRDVMRPDPVTVAPGATIEEAAVLMREHRIGALPVMERGALAGIITESDVFDAFIKVMGLRSGGARLTIQQAGDGEALRTIVDTVLDCEAGILSLAAYRLRGAGWIVVRVDAPFPLHVVQTLAERGINVTHLAPLRGAKADRSA